MKFFKKTILFLVIFVAFSSLYFSTSAKVLNTPGVNKYAWRATLNVLSFMPLTNADPFSGVIITDWYGISGTERYKINAYIVESILTSQTIKIKVFKQIKSGSSWIDSPISSTMNTQIENQILNNARELRFKDLND